MVWHVLRWFPVVICFATNFADATEVGREVERLKEGVLDPRSFDFGKAAFSYGEVERQAFLDLQSWSNAKWRTLEEEARSKLPEGTKFSYSHPKLCFDGWQFNVIRSAAEAVVDSGNYEEWHRIYSYGQDILQQSQAEIAQRVADAEKDDYKSSLARELNILLARQQGLSSPLLFTKLTEYSNLAQKYFSALLFPEECQLENEIAVRLRRMMEEIGWPIRSVHGKEGDYAAFMLLHNTSMDMTLLHNGLSFLEQYYETGETNPKYYANLYDIVAFYEGRQQRYGMVLNCKEGAYLPVVPIEDSANVEARRHAIGLPPLASIMEEYSKYC